MPTLAENVKLLSDEVARLKAELAESQRTAKALAEQIERYEPKDIDEKDQVMLRAIAQADNGLTHASLGEQLGEPVSIIAYRLNRAHKLGYIAGHGGGVEPMRYKIDGGGIAYLIGNKLL